VADFVLEAERAVLGCLLRDNRAAWRVGDLEPADFTDPDLGGLFGRFRGLIADGQGVDMVTAPRFLEGDAELVLCGDCVRTVVNAGNVAWHAEIVRNHARRRRARAVLEQALGRIDRDENVIPQTMAELHRLVSGQLSDWSYADAVAYTERRVQEDRDAEARGEAVAISTTLVSLDQHLRGGLTPGRLYVLAGRPGFGKSLFAQQIALGAARAGIPGGYISFEMPVEELIERAWAAKVPNGEYPLRLDTSSRTPDQVLGRIAEWHHRHGARFAVVDHLQRLRTPRRDRYQEITGFVSALKDIALDLPIAVLLLSQVARQVEREKRAPRLSDLRESGDIEQEADVVAFLHSVQDELGRGPAYDDLLLLVAKNRRGLPRARPIALKPPGGTMRLEERMV